MSSPNTMALTEVIAALREVKVQSRPTPSVAQLRRLITDVVDCVPLTQIIDRAELSEFAPADLLSFAEEFGKHRARVRKLTAPKGTPVAVSDTGTLIGIPTPELERARQAYQSGKRMRNSWRGIPKELLEVQGPLVVLPTGFEKTSAHGRDIGRSVAALAVDAVDDSEIIRFADRHFSESNTQLDADHVVLLHWVASNGLSEKLLEVGGLRATRREGQLRLEAAAGANPALAQLLVEAYDLLEVARVDALRGLSTLVLGPHDNMSELRAAARQARWLSPGELTRLEQLALQVEQAPDNTRLREILRRKVSSLALWVRANPGTFAVTGVDKLNSAHLTQILSASGLLVGETEEKAVIAELRTRLSEMGLVNDLDREIPEGLRAYKLGRLEEFYSSRQARLDGDPGWKLIYQPAQAAAALVGA